MFFFYSLTSLNCFHFKDISGGYGSVVRMGCPVTEMLTFDPSSNYHVEVPLGKTVNTNLPLVSLAVPCMAAAAN